MRMLNIQFKEKKIGGNTFYVRELPPLDSLALLGDMQSVITANLGKTVNADEMAKNFMDRDASATLGGIGQALKGKVLREYAERILDPNYVNVKMKDDDETVPLDENMQNIVFTGHLEDMLELMYFVLEVNYKGFFKKLQQNIGKVM